MPSRPEDGIEDHPNFMPWLQTRQHCLEVQLLQPNLIIASVIYFVAIGIYAAGEDVPSEAILGGEGSRL